MEMLTRFTRLLSYIQGVENPFFALRDEEQGKVVLAAGVFHSWRV